MSETINNGVRDKGGYLADIHGNYGNTGDRHRCESGDKGQRYMVVADFGGVEKTIGWTNNPTGGSLMTGAKKWPACKNPHVINRKPQPKVDQ